MRGIEPLQAARYQGSILTLQGSQVSHGAQGHQVEQPIDSQVGATIKLILTLCQRLGQLEGQPHTSQLFERIVASWLVGVDGSHGGGDVVTYEVVIGDDHIQAQPVCVGHLLHRPDATIDRQHHTHAFLSKLGESALIQTIAFVETVGNVRDYLPSQGGQGMSHQCRGGDTISVVIPVDGN